MTQSQPTLKTTVPKSIFKSVPISVIVNFIKLKSMGKTDLDDEITPYCQLLQCINCPCYAASFIESACSIVVALNLNYMSEVPWTAFNEFVESTYSPSEHPELYV